MKRFLISAALLGFVAGGGSALAADLPEPAPPPPQAPAAYIPTVAPVYNWGGIYFGVNGGYGFGSSEQSNPGVTTGSFGTTGFLVGGTVGANFQTDAFVFGIEGDFDGSWMEGNSSATTCVSGALAVQCDTKNTWLGTVRGRIGYAADRVLFYGTAGGAFGNIEQGAKGAANSTFASASKAGWTAGAGVEAAFADNWTARIEYLFVDLSNATFSTAPATTVKFNANLIRLGVDYKFR